MAQPRMRLDFPPGGFLRTDAAPAAAASASGGSSLGGSEMASGSVLWTVQHTSTTGVLNLRACSRSPRTERPRYSLAEARGTEAV